VAHREAMIPPGGGCCICGAVTLHKAVMADHHGGRCRASRRRGRDDPGRPVDLDLRHESRLFSRILGGGLSDFAKWRSRDHRWQASVYLVCEPLAGQRPGASLGVGVLTTVSHNVINGNTGAGVSTPRAGALGAVVRPYGVVLAAEAQGLQRSY
jgi:hypothetical protein